MFAYIEEVLTNGQTTLEFILICLLIGFVAAGGLAIYDRRVMGSFIRALIAREAFSKEKALTLAELGYEKKRSVIRALRGKGIFADTVYEASEEVEFDSETHALPIYREKFDQNTARFYIPEPLKYRAELRFAQRGTHIVILVLGTVLVLIMIVIAMLYKDRIAEAFSDIYHFIAGSSE